MKPVILVVLDGYGLAPPGPGNAIDIANPKCLKNLAKEFPSTTLAASGAAVGLPYNEVGNTEVGHLNIGAGRVVAQSLPRINTSIADGSFYENGALLGAVSHVKKNRSKLHIIGLIGEHRVHSSLDHLYALLYFCKEFSVDNVFLHIITDGRDSPPKSASLFIKPLEELMKRLELGKIAGIMGRYYAMDRDLHWERIEKAYSCLTYGVGNKARSWREAIESSYNRGLSDEFIVPTNIIDNKPILVEDHDAVVFFNYRIDRPRELTKAFVLDDFENKANIVSFDPYETKYYKSHLRKITSVPKPFKREKKLKDLYFATMTEYEKGLEVHVAFPPHIIKETLGEVISCNNLKQLRVSESEKERFVTIYFSGLHENAFKGEDRMNIPSLRVSTYDLAPSMSAPGITEAVVASLSQKKHQFILVNFANADMVGHTGNLKATVEAVKTLDKCVNEIVEVALLHDWTILITGDHGNAEEMINSKTHEVDTEHSSNPVPFIAVDNNYKNKKMKLKPGILADIAPTVLANLGINKPDVMTGESLLPSTPRG